MGREKQAEQRGDLFIRHKRMAELALISQVVGLGESGLELLREHFGHSSRTERAQGVKQRITSQRYKLLRQVTTNLAKVERGSSK